MKRPILILAVLITSTSAYATAYATADMTHKDVTKYEAHYEKLKKCTNEPLPRANLMRTTKYRSATLTATPLINCADILSMRSNLILDAKKRISVEKSVIGSENLKIKHNKKAIASLEN
jgi:hypothetical protein